MSTDASSQSATCHGCQSKKWNTSPTASITSGTLPGWGPNVWNHPPSPPGIPPGPRTLTGGNWVQRDSLQQTGSSSSQCSVRAQTGLQLIECDAAQDHDIRLTVGVRPSASQLRLNTRSLEPYLIADTPTLDSSPSLKRLGLNSSEPHPGPKRARSLVLSTRLRPYRGSELGTFINACTCPIHTKGPFGTVTPLSHTHRTLPMTVMVPDVLDSAAPRWSSCGSQSSKAGSQRADSSIPPPALGPSCLIKTLASVPQVLPANAPVPSSNLRVLDIQSATGSLEPIPFRPTHQMGSSSKCRKLVLQTTSADSTGPNLMPVIDAKSPIGSEPKLRLNKVQAGSVMVCIWRIDQTSARCWADRGLFLNVLLTQSPKTNPSHPTRSRGIDLGPEHCEALKHRQEPLLKKRGFDKSTLATEVGLEQSDQTHGADLEPKCPRGPQMTELVGDSCTTTLSDVSVSELIRAPAMENQSWVRILSDERAVGAHKYHGAGTSWPIWPAYNRVLNVDGACDGEDSSDEGEDNSEEIVIKQELPDQIEIFPEDRGLPVPRGANLQPPKQEGIFKCSDCEDEFLTQVSLLCHKVFLHMHHYCPFCQILFKSGQEKSVHMMMNHSEHRCDQCRTDLNSYHEFQAHRYVEHGIFHCPFCGYLIPDNSLEIHLKNHFISPEFTDGLENVVKLFDKNLQIVGKETKMTLTCHLCTKKLVRKKVFPHVRYRHNFTPDFAVAFLAQAGFTLNKEIFENVPVPAPPPPAKAPVAPKSPVSSAEETPMAKIVGSRTNYCCPVGSCTEIHNDSGLHLLIDHGQAYCHLCDEFFANVLERNTHVRDQHNHQCSLCEAHFNSLFKLWDHRIQVHHSYTCVFCKDLIINSFDHFAKHWKTVHEVNNENLCRRDEFRLATLMINTVLFEINDETNVLQCNVCCKREIPLESKEIIRNHFADFHKIHLPILFYFFNGSTSFCLEKSERSILEAPNEDHECIVCHGHFPTNEAVQAHLLTAHMDHGQEGEEEDKKSEVLAALSGTHFLSEDKDVDDEEEEEDDDDGDHDDEEDEEPGPSTEVVVNPDLPTQFLDSADSDEIEDENEEIEGEVGKAPVFLSCEICNKILPSMLAFSQHMRSEHKGSEQERNKPYTCDICGQSYYFLPSLNAHMSKGHKVVNGKETYPCKFCSTVTNCRTNMKRHLRRAHPEEALKDHEFANKCDFCDDTFWREAEKLRHVLKVHPEMKIVAKCRLCDQISANKNALRRHFGRMHPGENMEGFNCVQCDKEYPTKQELHKHTKEVHPDIYQCTQCEDKFKARRDLDKHVQEIHAKRPPPKAKQTPAELPCEICGNVFETKASHAAHMRSHRSLFPKFKCQLCGEKMLTKAEKQAHYDAVHPGECQYKCPTCGAGFNSKGAFHNHKKTHEVQYFKCEYCEKEFNRRDSYKEHLLIHTGPRYRCPHCPKEFVQKSNLNRHIRIHLNIKPYKCGYCEKSFSDKGACRSHEKLHTGELKEACKYCGQIFSRGQKLRYHMRIHTGEGLLKCELCEKVFTNGYSMKKHLSTVHSSSEGEACIICGFCTRNTKTLANHMKKNHPDFGTRCKECGLAFRSFTELNRHIHSVHRGNQKTGFSCRHCSAIFNSQTDIRTHLIEEHHITEDHALHFLNHFKNEQDIPISGDGSGMTMTPPDPLGDTSTSSAEPSTSSSAAFGTTSSTPIFTCVHCRAEFNSIQFLLGHWKAEPGHKPEKFCGLCNKKFKSHIQVNNHILTKHVMVNVKVEEPEYESDEDDFGEESEDNEPLEVNLHEPNIHMEVDEASSSDPPKIKTELNPDFE